MVGKGQLEAKRAPPPAERSERKSPPLTGLLGKQGPQGSVISVRSGCRKTRENYKGKGWYRGWGEETPRGPEQDSWGWTSGKPGMLGKRGSGDQGWAWLGRRQAPYPHPSESP